MNMVDEQYRSRNTPRDPPDRPTPPRPKFECIPAELCALPQWVLWKYELNGGKTRWTKMPYRTNGTWASVDYCETWASFDTVRGVYERAGHFDGIGFVTSSDDPYLLCDLDKVFDFYTGELEDWAKEIVSVAEQENAYIETSPSGAGLHIIGRGEPLARGKTNNRAELYSSKRFFTFTGDGSGPPMIGTLSETRKLVLRRIEGDKAKTNGSGHTNGAAHDDAEATGGGFSGADAELIEKARNAGNGAKFSRLFDATDGPDDYKSTSEADEALIAILAFWCGPDAERIERLMRQSGRARDKWDEDRGPVSWLLYSINNFLQRPDLQFYGHAAAEKPAVRFLAGPDRAMLSEAEIAGVPIEPPAVVAGYLPQDCGSESAPGGAGKTTLAIYESVHIILGKPLWGREILKPGKVLFLTAEDSREITAYRLNRICTAMGLSVAEREHVRREFCCEDLSDKLGARLVAMVRGEVAATELPGEIIDQYSGRNVSYVHSDPTSLLGPGEASGNDGMSELMRVGRRVSRGLLASVRNIHHVSQYVARAGIQDQHVGRGGTAFADNGRFSHQLVVVPKRKHAFNGAEYLLPQAATDDALRRGQVLAILIHKVSYMERPAEPIFILREGFRYEQLHAARVADSTAPIPGADDAKHIPKIVDYLHQKLAEGVKYSTSKFTDTHWQPLGLNRVSLRRIVDEGLQTGIFEEAALPPNECKAKLKTYLRAKPGLYA